MTGAPSRLSAVPYSAPTLVGALCIALIMTGTLVSACDSGGSNSEEFEADFIPVQEGAQWTYEFSGFGEGGGTTTLSITEEGNSLLDTEYIYGTDAPVEILIEQSSEGQGIIVGVSDGSGGILAGESMLLKYPVEDGGSYQYTDRGGNNTFDITISREMVDVPAGTFDCLRYTISNVDAPTSADVWIKPGVGPIQFFVDGDASGRSYQLQSTNVDF